MATNNKRLCCC